MRRISRVRWGSLWVTLVWGLGIAALPGFAQAPGAAQQQATLAAKVLEPKDGAQVGYGEMVKGRVPAGYSAFLAVAPLGSAPRIWIQPPVAVKTDGTFNGLVWPGTKEAGIGDKYNLFVFAHKDKQHFQEGQVLMGVPPECGTKATQECLVSDPVTVVRTK